MKWVIPILLLTSCGQSVGEFVTPDKLRVGGSQGEGTVVRGGESLVQQDNYWAEIEWDLTRPKSTIGFDHETRQFFASLTPQADQQDIHINLNEGGNESPNPDADHNEDDTPETGLDWAKIIGGAVITLVTSIWGWIEFRQRRASKSEN